MVSIYGIEFILILLLYFLFFFFNLMYLSLFIRYLVDILLPLDLLNSYIFIIKFQHEILVAGYVHI